MAIGIGPRCLVIERIEEVRSKYHLQLKAADRCGRIRQVFIAGETKMKRIVICLVFVLLFVGVANGQTKTMTGTVIETPKGMYAWAAIVIKVGNKKYYVPTLGADVNTQKTVGTIDEVGRVVRVFYTKIVNSRGYDGEVKATKIVEVKKSKSRKT
jgi:hypothetical protein